MLKNEVKVSGKVFAGLLCCLSLFLGAEAATATDRDPLQAVVAVVGVDDQGQPRRQGLGVIVGKDGRIITSAALLASGRGVVRTAKGAKHLVQEIIHRDPFQDLALIKIEADQLPAVEVGAAGRVHPGEVLRFPSRDGKGLPWREARTVSLHPFSPRLILVKLEPTLSEVEPGAPLFNQRGELVAMVHAFSGGSGLGPGFQVVLARDRTLLPRESWVNFPAKPPAAGKGDTDASPANKPLDLAPGSPPGAPWPEHVASPAEPGEKGGEGPHDDFWQGVRASLALDWQTAQERFGKALARPGGPPEAAFGRGVARYHLGDDAGAAQDFREAASRLPAYALASLWLGKTWERQGNRTEAREAYQQAVRQAPDLKEAWFHLGLLAYQEGLLDQAQEALERAGESGPQGAQRFFYLGNIAQRRGRLQQAQEAYREALKRDANLLPAYLEGGKTLLDLGRPREAATLLNELLQRSPQQPQARYYLALAHLAAWNLAGAWEQYFALQKLNPDLAARLIQALERGR